MKLYENKSRISEQHVKADHQAMDRVPDGLWITCPKCHQVFLREKLGKFRTCPECGYGFRTSARQRVEWLTDDFTEILTDIEESNPIDFEGFDKKIEQCREKSGIDESVLTGIAEIEHEKCALAIMDPDFIMGSLGSVTGEKLTRLFEMATQKRLPVVLFALSGGARMQDGIYSLMQMQKVTQAVLEHSNAGLFYLTILTDPTTGGVTASFANQSDIILAEPKALIGFAGRRVIEQTMHQKIADDLQSAETLMKNGLIDDIVPRNRQKQVIAKLLRLNRTEAAND